MYSGHAVQQEEKEQLLREMTHLRAQINALRRQALGVSGSSSSESDALASLASEHSQLAAAVLRPTLQQQLAQFADAQVLFSAVGVRHVHWITI